MYEDHAYRIEVQNERVKRILAIDPQSGDTIRRARQYYSLPARLHLLRDGWVEEAMLEIQEELDGRLQEFQRQGKRLEAQRLEAATLHDIDDLRKYGHCPGMENYCRALNRRSPGAPPDTLTGLSPGGLLAVHRRVARHDPADSRHVRRQSWSGCGIWWTTASACPARWTAGR